MPSVCDMDRDKDLDSDRCTVFLQDQEQNAFLEPETGQQMSPGPPAQDTRASSSRTHAN